MASSSSSSYSTVTPQRRYAYDVFLSFRGEDTRDNFTSHLYDALKRKQILTFIDNNELNRGEEISPSLLRAIHGSKISVIIFSPNYATSKWCLEELTEIIECTRTNGRMVIPLFYHVDPSHVRNQTGSFSDAFAKHEQQGVLPQKLQTWKAALKEAGNLSGWDSSVTRPETKLINEIVEDILKKLNQMSQVHPINWVGIESDIKNVESLLCLESPKVLSVGIWGMGGIGKTTLAKSVFCRICTQFEGFHFVENFKEELKRDGIVSLTNKILSRLLGEESLYMGTLSLLLTFTLERLRQKKVLIVFDDVDDLVPEQLKELLTGWSNLFGPGSKILVTSRDKQVLKNLLVDEVYKVGGLNNKGALELFSLSAFKKNFPPNDHIELSYRVVKYANGNPLAIKVLGSTLFDKSKDERDSALDKLEEVPKPSIMNVLRISYDGLSNEEKNIFLDIAFFWRGEDLKCATKVLDNDYFCVRFIIGNLVNKSLITISLDNKLNMHDLLHEMSLSIVQEESIANPGKRSRLCDAKHIYNVLTQKKGTKAIQGICLDLSKSREMHLESDAFKRMTGLRFLKFYNRRSSEKKVHLPRHGLRYLSNGLSYLHWDGFPSKSLSQKFCAENLVELTLRNSKVKHLWSGVQYVVNLKRLDLSDSKYLIEIPNLSKAEKIECILLSACKSLVELPSSIQYLEKLECLEVTGCTNLVSLPRKIDSEFLKILRLDYCPHVRKCPEISGNLEVLDVNWTAIEEVPKSIHDKLKDLRMLGLRNSKIFPELSGNMEYLDLTKTAIEKVPSSIGSLNRLETLKLQDNKMLLQLPSSLCKLKSLRFLSICNSPKLESFPEILEPMESLTVLELGNCNILEIHGDMFSMLPSLAALDLSGNNFKSLPTEIKQLDKLIDLVLSHCKHLCVLPELPSSLETLEANDCESLETFPSLCTNVYLWKLELRNCLKLEEKALHEITSPSKHLNYRIFPGCEIPEWFSYRSAGSSLTIQLAVNGHQVTRITFCAVIASGKLSMSNMENARFRYHLKANNGEHPHRDGVLETCFFFHLQDVFKSDHLLLWRLDDYDYRLLDFAPKGASIEFDLGLMKHFKVKKCGVHLLYDIFDQDYFSDSDEEFSGFGQDYCSDSGEELDAFDQDSWESMREDGKLKRDHGNCCSNDAEPRSESGRSDSHNPNKRMKLLQS